MRVSWTAKKTNLILQQAGVERSLMQSIKERKLKYCGYVLLETRGIFGEGYTRRYNMPGTRRRRRPRMSWRDNIGDWTGMSMKEVLYLLSVQDRDRWRRAVHNATKLRSKDG